LTRKGYIRAFDAKEGTNNSKKSSSHLRAGDITRYTSCGYHCFRNCILKVRIRDGVIVSCEPDDTINHGIPREDNYLSEDVINKGLVQTRPCAKGYAQWQMIYDPNRVKYPMKRVDKDEILDRLNKIKRLRHEDESRLNDLLKTRENLTNLADTKVKLSQLYDRVLENLQHSTPEIKALALDALDIKVYAKGTDNVEIQGVIPVELPTTAQTLA